MLRRVRARRGGWLRLGGRDRRDAADLAARAAAAAALGHQHMAVGDAQPLATLRVARCARAARAHVENKPDRDMAGLRGPNGRSAGQPEA